MSVVYSISGLAGSGKSTAAAVLSKKLGIPVVHYADALKQICQRVFNLSHEQCYIAKEAPFAEPVVLTDVHLLKINGMLRDFVPERYIVYPTQVHFVDLVGTRLHSPRHVLQFIGTDFIRNRIHPDWHCFSVVRDPPFIVGDTRFANELVFLANRYDVVPIYVTRPGLTQGTHASETQDMRLQVGAHPNGRVIENDGTLEEFEIKVAG